MNNLHLILNILGTEHIFVLFTALYINFRTDANKLCPLYLLAVVLKMCKTRERGIFGHSTEHHVT